jgi:signal transduction histidine kinase
MKSPIVSIETTDGTCVRALTDIGHVLAFSEQTEARLPRALELLRQMVDCKHCAVLIETTSQRQLFATVPVLHGIADALRGRLHQLLHTVREQAPRGTNLEPYRVAETVGVGSRSLAVPLVSADEILGILHVGRDTGEYSVHELRLLALVASQFAAYGRELQMLDQAERARTLAEETNRAKDRFLTTLSHELRNPLNVMQGWLQMLRSGPASEAATRKALEVIERNVDVQAQLVDQLLDAARIASGKFHMEIQPLDILAVISTTVDGVRPSAASRSIELDYEVPSPRAWRIDGDPMQLQRAFANLLVNAVKFTPTGGHVRVGVEQLGSQLRVAFRDTGVGIASEHLPKIFEPYWQADGATMSTESGLGLGLSIVRHIVQHHGGRVAIESDGPGQGTTVTVLLPLPADAGVPQADRS